MTYIVYISTGEYSGYGVQGVYLGEVEPKALIDAMVQRETDGAWKTLSEKDTWQGRWSKMTPDERSQWTRYTKKVEELVIPTLEAAGFKLVEAQEFHL